MADKPAKPPADKTAIKASPEKRAKPPAPAPKEEKEEQDDEAPSETEEFSPRVGESEGEAPGDEEREEKPAKETAVTTEAAPKNKKKAKGETGVTAKPGGFASMFSFSKPAPAGVWGVDLGQCALKAIRLEIIDGEVTATAFDYVEHPKILSQPDADPDELTREALQKFLSRNTLRGDTVAISVPGQSGLARFVKLPPVEEKKIPDIVRFEAKQQIPFNLDEVVWDYQKLGVGELAAGFVETEIGLFAMKRDMVNRYLQHFKEVGVEVHLVQMAPLSLCNYVAYDLLGRDSAAPATDEEGGRSKRHCITALDIGADSSNLVITDGARIIWQRPIPLGGNHFTRALTKDLKLTFAKAEHLKRNAVKSPDLKKILASLKPVLTDFVGEVQRSLGYFTNTHRDAQIDYMIGLGNAFRLPGLQRFLAEKLQMDVRKLGKMERLTGDSVVGSATYTENILSFAVAYGLALQGLKRSKLQTNLLPTEIRTERAVRGKKPWAVAAAALLLLGLTGFAAAGACNYFSYASPVLTAPAEATPPGAIAQAKAVQDRAGAAQADFDKHKGDAQKEEEAVKSIIAGQYERKDWLEMTRFLFGEAPPNPDPRFDARVLGWSWKPAAGKQPNLTDDAYAKYFGGGGGATAFDELQKRWHGLSSDKDASGKPAAAGDDPGANIDDLVQVNIEYFDQRYTDDLAAVWTRIKDGKDIATGAAPIIMGDADALRTYTRTADLNAAPTGRGWVVEVHGSTYHSEAKTFLVDTLVDNIYRLERQAGGGRREAGAAQPGAAGRAAPAAPGATPAAPGTPPAKAGPLSDKDVYEGRISHVVLFDAEAVNSTHPNSIVGQSVLDRLIGSKAALGGPMGMGMGPGGTGPAPLASGNSGAGGMPNPGGPPAAAPPAAPGGTTVVKYKSRDDWRPLSTFQAARPPGSRVGRAGRRRRPCRRGRTPTRPPRTPAGPRPLPTTPRRSSSSSSCGRSRPTSRISSAARTPTPSRPPPRSQAASPVECRRPRRRCPPARAPARTNRPRSPTRGRDPATDWRAAGVSRLMDAGSAGRRPLAGALHKMLLAGALTINRGGITR